MDASLTDHCEERAYATHENVMETQYTGHDERKSSGSAHRSFGDLNPLLHNQPIATCPAWHWRSHRDRHNGVSGVSETFLGSLNVNLSLLITCIFLALMLTISASLHKSKSVLSHNIMFIYINAHVGYITGNHCSLTHRSIRGGTRGGVVVPVWHHTHLL